MRGFRSGKFSRESVGGPLKMLTPDEAFEHYTDIPLSELAAEGIRLVLLDVDNTLVPWQSNDLTEELQSWIADGKQLGLAFCIISNTHNKQRIKWLGEQLGIGYVEGRIKPSAEMFERAMEKFGVGPAETIMVGDQLLTDVWGANRSGVRAYWVRPIANREFVGTKVNRLFERFIRSRIYSVLQEEEDDLPIVPKTGIFQSRIARQFAKFCIVGGTSFIIDAGLHRFLLFHASIGGVPVADIVGSWWTGMVQPSPEHVKEVAHNAAFTVFKVFSAGIAILNSFIWNRRWTFSIKGREDRAAQLMKFIVVSVIGMVLNVVVASMVNQSLGTSVGHRWTIATIIAAAVVAIWNFSGQRLWAFRKRSG